MEKNYFVEETDVVEEKEFTIDLNAVFWGLVKNAWIIVTCMLLCGSIAYVITRAMTPTYKCGFTAYLNNKSVGSKYEYSDMLSSADIQAAKDLTSIYSEILTSRELLMKAAKKANMDYEYKELGGMVKSDSRNGTEIMEINVIMEDPNEALALADALTEVAPEFIAEIVDGSSMKIIDKPVLPDGVYRPRMLVNVLLGLMLGGFVSVLAVAIYVLSDDTIQSEEALKEDFGVVIIGSIPDLESAEKKEHGFLAKK